MVYFDPTKTFIGFIANVNATFPACARRVASSHERPCWGLHELLNVPTTTIERAIVSPVITGEIVTKVGSDICHVEFKTFRITVC